MATIRQQFRAHAESIGLSIEFNSAYIPSVTEFKYQWLCSFSVEDIKVPVVRVVYSIGTRKEKKGSMSIPLDAFLAMSENDISLLKTDIILRTDRYDTLMTELDSIMPEAKREITELLE